MKAVFSCFILFIFLFSCSLRLPKVVNSTRQDWSVLQKNISGTVFHLVLKSTTSNAELKIDSLCISKEIIKDFKYSVLGKSNTTTDFTQGDSILISFNKENKKNYLKYSKHKHDGVFIRLRNKNKFVKITAFKILPPIIND